MTKLKRARVMSQMVEHLPSKHKALSSNPSTAKRGKKERKKERKEEGEGRKGKGGGERR
jgi:hypothetical protein